MSKDLQAVWDELENEAQELVASGEDPTEVYEWAHEEFDSLVCAINAELELGFHPHDAEGRL